MQGEHWKQVEQLFEAAQRQPADRRVEFLRQACPADPELCAEVESLLKAADTGDPLLDGSPLSSIAERPPGLKPGSKLGNFEIVVLIGRGGMGEVYRARDLRLKREVAIKTLPPGFAGDPDRIARFEREARAASALNHPNIVSVHDIGHEGGVSFIVSELVEGETLTQVIGHGPLPLRKLIEVGTQICEGLAASHAAGVIHRDLKPSNIMLTRDGRVKILDFGLARQDRAQGFDSTTMEASSPGMILGTPGYMSPEQVRGEPTDARSDLFSLGVVLYEMACGQRAFRGTSSIEVMNSILKDEPPELPSASPPSLDRIIRRCIEKQPARRFQSAADLGFALNSLALPAPLQPAVRSDLSKRAWLKWAAVGAIALTAAGALWVGLRPKGLAVTTEFTLRRLTNDSILSWDAVISPDGKMVAFSRPQTDSTDGDIWVQQADGGNPVRVTDDPADDHDPSFSADGTQIAFRSERQGGGIYLVPVLGGEPRELVPEGRAPSFSPDGRSLMYWSGELGGRLFVMPVSGGTPTRIGANADPEQAVWSPDGKRILLLGRCEPLGAITTCVSTADGRDLKPNHDLDREIVDLNTDLAGWVATPSSVIIQKRVSDQYVLTAVPVSEDGTRVTGSPVKLTSLTDPIVHVSTAVEGRVVMAVSTAKVHTWELPIDANGHQAGAPAQITAGPDGETGGTLSRDGGQFVFTSPRANGERLLYKDLTTGHQKEISTGEGAYWSAAFNRDGSGLMAAQGEAVYYLPLSGGVPKKIWEVPKLAALGVDGARRGDFLSLWDWSPDGKTLLLTMAIPRGGVVRQLDLDSHSTVPFLEDPEFDTWEAHFSHDGRWVVFNATSLKGKSSRVYIASFRKAPIPRSEWIPITNGEWDDKPRFSSDDKMIFFVTGARGKPHSVWSQRLKADMQPDGKPVFVYSPPDSRRSITYDDINVGPRLIVFTQFDPPTGNIWLLEPAKADAK